MTIARLMAATSLALLTACSHEAARQNVTINDQRDCPVRLQPGQKLTLLLPSDPTTGYRWRVQDDGQRALRSLGPEVFSNPEDAGLVGGAGQSMWRFEALRPATATLVLVSQQPWAPEVNPVKTFQCAVTVAP